MMKWKGCGTKQSWSNLRYNPGICLEGPRKTTKTSVRIAGLRAERETLAPIYKSMCRYCT
jgi:hypothetical protein